MERQRLRSPLGRAAGLGSAKEGVGHWWLERVTAVALVPLTLWLAASLIMLSDSDYASFIAWLKSPFVALSIVCNGSRRSCATIASISSRNCEVCSTYRTP